MRWDDLFADLEAQVAAADDAAWHADVADLADAERAEVSILDRLLAHIPHALRLALIDDSVAHGNLVDCGDGWLRLATTGLGELLVPTHAVVSMTGLGRLAVLPADSGEGSTHDRGARTRGRPAALARRLSLPSVLRAMARRRMPVELRLLGPRALTGSLGDVGADHLDLAEHARDDVRRAGTSTARHTVRLAAVVSVRPL